MSEKPNIASEDRLSTGIIYGLVFLVPTVMLPGILSNAFDAPKVLTFHIGVFTLLAIFNVRYFIGSGIPVAKSPTGPWLLFLVIFNLASLLFTQNEYYSRMAALININCLIFIYLCATSLIMAQF